MRIKGTAFSIFIVTLIFGIINGVQAQNEDVSSNLEVYRITTNAGGEQIAEQVTTTSPGDTLEYRLTYTNNLVESISNLQPVLPVPSSVAFLGNSADPELSSASLDAEGNTFQSLPIQREETLENGEVIQREVPAMEYRRLRWTVSTLASQQSVTLTARVRVIAETTQ